MSDPPTATVRAAAPSPRTLLRRAGRALKLGRGLTLLAVGVVLAGVVLALWLLADARLRFGLAGRWVGLMAMLLPLLAALGLAVRAVCCRLGDAALARRLELATGRDDNALVNAVQLESVLAASPEWRGLALGELAGLWHGTAWQRVYDWRRLRRWAAAAGGLALCGAVAFLLQPREFSQRMARVLMPAREIAPITATRVVEVFPGNRTVARGISLAMGATLAGAAPDEVWLVVARDGGATERHAAAREGTGFTWSVTRPWQESGRYWFEAGDARSFERRIEVRMPARMIARQLAFTPPAYTKLPPQSIADGTPWPAIPQGSEVALTATFDRELKSLAVERDEAAVRPGADAATWTVAGRLTTQRGWTARWTDALDLADRERIEFDVKADEPPRVRLIAPTGDEELLVTRDDWLRLSFEASDDYGLADVTVFRGSQEKPDARPVQSWNPRAAVFRQRAEIPLSRWLQAAETEAWFCVAATDGNDLTGPGRTLSRMIVVRVVSPEELRRAAETRQGTLLGNLAELIQLQHTNLDATRALAAQTGQPEPAAAAPLAERQLLIQETAGRLLAATPPDVANWREALAAVHAREMPQAVVALRDAASTTAADRRAPLARAEALQAAILARLRALPTDLADEARGAAARDLAARVEALLQRQQALHARMTSAAAPDAAALAADQDALAEDARAVRQALADGAHDSSVGDAAFRAALGKAAALMAETNIRERMLLAAEQLEDAAFAAAATISKRILADLARVLALLDTSRREAAGEMADALKDTAAAIREKLAAAIEQQRAVVEKSKELARKDESSPDDEATAAEIAVARQQLAELIEQMLVDAHLFPDLRPMNELRAELTKIYEDVIQQDAAQAAADALKPTEIAVNKEDALLQALEQAAETAEDMEMWLPDKNDTIRWAMENYDVTEMPEIPNLPLADAFTDLVGDLLEEQQSIYDQVQDPASNVAFAVNPANGWDVMDGPMPGFNAQGRSGNTRPNENEQTGRSSGGREGMSSGEMVNQRADSLEGSAIKARRTNDPIQQGKIEDDGPPADAKATGGGKAGGISQRDGMTGQAPPRPVNTPNRILNDALAAEQALLAQQAAKSYTTARLFYLRTGAMPEVTRLMDESRAALQAGRLAEYEALHRRIVARLKELQESGANGEVLALDQGGRRMLGEKSLPGGDDTQVPPGFQPSVDDYFRSLNP